MELEVQIKELEDNIAALKEAHTESLAGTEETLKCILHEVTCILS